MEGIKLIDASEVSVKKNISKIEIKKTKKSPMKIITESPIKIITESPIKIITDSDKQNVPEITTGNDIKSSDEHVNKLPQGTIGREIRAIKLKEEIYYGPKNVNKNKFVRMYKNKNLGLKWMENVPIGGMMVDGWFNQDRSQYIIKLLEDGDFKRFKFYGCDEIYDYFIGLGAVTFDHTKENSLSSNYMNNKVNNPSTGNIDIGNVNSGDTDIRDVNKGIGSANIPSDFDKNYEFIGADLWSGYRTRQLLKDMPDNWGVKWT